MVLCTVSSSSSTANSIMSNPLAAYQKAAAEINKNGAAGYNLRQWERIENFTFNPDPSNSSGLYEDILESYMTTEDEAETKISAKGSDDAKRRMPLSNCTSSYVKNANAVKQGENYLITIVMKDQTNPTKADTNGLNVMSNHLLYNEDIQDTVKNDSSVRQLVKSYSGNVVYKNYTIKALMTPSGKFISINHSTRVVLSGNATLIWGNSAINCEMTFETQYRDFVY